MIDTRHIHLVAAAGKIRTASYNGRDHLIMPVTALVEGVLHAVNSPIPELVLAQEFAISAASWNGRPVMMDHPEANGAKVSANDPQVLEASQFGSVFNTRVANGKLTMEAWFDPARAEAVGPAAVRTLERIRAADSKDPIEVSVGVYMMAEQATGKHNGKPYEAVWRHITPDHLAILPEGKTGACSVAMGCGIRHATVYLATASGYQEFRGAGDAPGHEFHGNQWSGGGEGKKDKEGGRRSHEGYGGSPTPKIGDKVKVMGKVHGEGKTVEVVDSSGSFLVVEDKKGETFSYHASDLQKIGSDSKPEPKPEPFDDDPNELAQSDALDYINSPEGKAQSAKDNAEMAARIERGDFKRPGDAPAEKPYVPKKRLTGPEKRKALRERIKREAQNRRERGGAVGDKQRRKDFVMEQGRKTQKLVREIRKRDSSMSILARIRSLFASPEAPSDDVLRTAIEQDIEELYPEETEVESEVAPDAEVTAAEGCKCHEGAVDMNKVERIKALMARQHNPLKDEKILTAATDDVLKTLEEHADKLDAADKIAADLKKAEETATNASKEVADLKAAASRELTEDEFLKTAPASLRTMLERHKAADAKAHGDLVARLKTAQSVHSEEALKLKSLEQLQEMAALLKMAPVDFSLHAVPRAAESKGDDDSYKSQPPPDGYALALAKRQATH